MGPTASGKTALAVEMVLQRFPVEIVSVDSTLIYRGMDIGTAKPSLEILKVAPHRLVDIIDPTEIYSAGQFRNDAIREIANIHACGHIPLLVGGTMLYFRVLERGLAAELPLSDQTVRNRLAAELKECGSIAMHTRLARVDPAAALCIHPHDQQRVQRALEVYDVMGCSITELWVRAKRELLPFRIIKFVIAPTSRQLLRERIEQRFLKMLDMGLVAEVEWLRERGDLNLGNPSMRAVGYRQVWGYLDGNLDFASMVERGILATYHLAKRQLTWLRADSSVEWFNSADPDLLERILNRLCSVV
jgi:tRNA dimethylallyltransferase